MANFNLIGKEPYFGKFFPLFFFLLITYTWRNTTNDILTKIRLSPFSKFLLKPKSYSTWFSLYIQNNSDFLRIIVIAVLCYLFTKTEDGHEKVRIQIQIQTVEELTKPSIFSLFNKEIKTSGHGDIFRFKECPSNRNDLLLIKLPSSIL